MKFSVWFKQWIRSFFKLLTVGTIKRRNKREREKERVRHLKAKFSVANKYRVKKKRRRRRSSFHVQKERFITSLFKFLAISFGVLLLPFGLFDWGIKSVKARKANKLSTNLRKGTANSITTQNGLNGASTAIGATKEKEAKSAGLTDIKSLNETAEFNPEETASCTLTEITLLEETNSEPRSVKDNPPEEPDENTPKSTPKNEKDRYIRKRLIIAGSCYCDKEILECLEVGTYFNLEAEPDNPHDKDAVKLLYNGRKIGYVAKQDCLAFVTCLKFNRDIYGVITDVKQVEGCTQYEFETWFDYSKLNG